MQYREIGAVDRCATANVLSALGIPLSWMEWSTSGSGGVWGGANGAAVSEAWRNGVEAARATGTALSWYRKNNDFPMRILWFNGPFSAFLRLNKGRFWVFFDYSFEILKIIRYSKETKSLFETHLLLKPVTSRKKKVCFSEQPFNRPLLVWFSSCHKQHVTATKKYYTFRGKNITPLFFLKIMQAWFTTIEGPRYVRSRSTQPERRKSCCTLVWQ